MVAKKKNRPRGGGKTGALARALEFLKTRQPSLGCQPLPQGRFSPRVKGWKQVRPLVSWA
ncbi:unnamed protein product, partial [Gulo gulo]